MFVVFFDPLELWAFDENFLNRFSRLCYKISNLYLYCCFIKDLGMSCRTQRPTSVVLVQENDSYKDHYIDCYSQISQMPLPL